MAFSALFQINALIEADGGKSSLAKISHVARKAIYKIKGEWK
jgi:hypothetical protein